MNPATVFTTLIDRYKRKVDDLGLGDETYKWEWISRYQGWPNLDSDQFLRELQLLTRTNLMYQISSAVLVHMAKTRPDDLKALLAALYDERVDLQTRIVAYRRDAEALYVRVRTDPRRSSHQDERTVAALLALRYPDRYPIYKEGLYQKLCKQLGRTLSKPGEKYVDYIHLVKEFVESHIRPDAGLIELVRSGLPDGTYDDPNFLLLAQDILYQNFERDASDRVVEPDPGKPRVWLFSPGPNASKWEEFQQTGIASIGWGQTGDLSPLKDRAAVIARMKELWPEVGKNDTLACFEFAHVMKPGDVIITKRGRSEYLGVGNVRSNYRFDSTVDDDHAHVRDVTWLKAGSWIADGKLAMKTLTDITKYPDYVRKLKAQIGFGDSDIEDETEITTPISPTSPLTPYTLASATSGNFLEPAWLQDSLALWRMKKNLILQGPPGTGKTFVAKRLAWLLMGEEDDSRLHLVQFHPSYSYEDFIEGYRPDGKGGFILKSGHFLSFCKRAASDPDRDYVFVIDEINRGNLSKVFGEVMMGIEADKRGEPIHLQYAKPDEPPFGFPKNVYLLGTMNTADRSLALVDYALRRRFAFKTVEPEFGPRFEAFLKERKVAPEFITHIISMMKDVNARIESDGSLGTGYFVGHSYFCAPPEDPAEQKTWLNRIWWYEVFPLMEEYWFDQPEKVDEMRKLLGVP